MNKARLTRETVKRAIAFLEKRLEHARAQDNKEWAEEYENVLAVIRGLAACE